MHIKIKWIHKSILNLYVVFFRHSWGRIMKENDLFWRAGIRSQTMLFWDQLIDLCLVDVVQQWEIKNVMKKGLLSQLFLVLKSSYRYEFSGLSDMACVVQWSVTWISAVQWRRSSAAAHWSIMLKCWTMHTGPEPTNFGPITKQTFFCIENR